MNMGELRAEWTDDCQGKKDFDGEIVTLSTRYWPRGGGFDLMVRDASGKLQTEYNDSRPEIKPSAKSSILLDGECVTSEEFDGETFEDVAAQVEAWAKEQHAKIVAAIENLFAEGEATK
jgi:hypothetical protein